jgi:hypothetical protein
MTQDRKRGRQQSCAVAREPNQQPRVFSFAWEVGMLSRAGSRGGREWLHLCSGHGVFKFRRELTTQSHLSVLGWGLLLAKTPDLRPPARKVVTQPSLRRVRASKGAKGPIRTHTESKDPVLGMGYNFVPRQSHYPRHKRMS